MEESSSLMQFSDMRVCVKELNVAYFLSLARKMVITKLHCGLVCGCIPWTAYKSALAYLGRALQLSRESAASRDGSAQPIRAVNSATMASFS